MTSPDMGPGGSWEAPDGSRPWNTGDSSPDGLAFMAAADEEHWRETAFRAPFRQSYNPIGAWSNGISGIFTAIIGGLFNGWFGGGSVGDPQEVQYTIEAIKDAIINGYNVETKVQSGTWTKPENLTELVVILIGGGVNGENGQNNDRDSAGGKGGGFLAQQLDPATVAATTSYVVGNSNNPSSFGTHATTTPGSGGISTSFGFTPTTSLPGNGGSGGRGGTDNRAGAAGGASALGVGGTAGAAGTSGSTSGKPGGAGGNVSAATTTKCGGGGGGGGGGEAPANIGSGGGSGGPGGYPGGGGGGGGGRMTSGIILGSNGAGGIGATGIVWIFWR